MKKLSKKELWVQSQWAEILNRAVQQCTAAHMTDRLVFEEAARDCLRRWYGHDLVPTDKHSGKETYAWHVHHEMLVERLQIPVWNRVKCIVFDKPVNEIEVRLKYMIPLATFPSQLVKKLRILCHTHPPQYSRVKGFQSVMKLHARQVPPECPWDGHTLFPGIPNAGANFTHQTSFAPVGQMRTYNNGPQVWPSIPHGWRKLQPSEMIRPADRCYHPRKKDYLPTKIGGEGAIIDSRGMFDGRVYFRQVVSV